MSLLKNITREKVNFYSACLFVFSLPFYRWLSSYFLVLWILTWIIEADFKKKFLENKNNLVLLFLPIAYYLFHIVSIIYSTNLPEGFFDLEVKLAFIVFPLVFFSINDLYRKNFKTLLNVFVAANLTASVICLLHSLYLSISLVNGAIVFDADATHTGFTTIQLLKNGASYFMYAPLSMFIHTGYFSLFIVFSISILLFNSLKGCKTKIKRVFIIILICYFSVFNYLLFSRSGLLNIAIVIAGYFIIMAFTKKSKKIKIINGVIIFVFISFIIAAFTSNIRFKETINDIKTFKLETRYESYPNYDRLPIWFTSLKLIEQNWFLGVGTGDVMDNLKYEYKKHNLTKAYDEGLNVHNQFLETYLGIGLLGFLTLIGIFMIPLFQSLKRKNYLFAFFLITSFVFCFIESMFNSQVGVVYFILFYCIFNKAGNENHISETAAAL